jgi:curved DNA-binding protein CbpA
MIVSLQSYMSSNIGDLIGQMNPKRNPEEIDINKKPSEEKFKATVKEVTFDYYKILGVESTATLLEIKRAYQSKLKKLHPDKVEQTKENKAKYKLLREAGDLLCDPHERKAYDMQKKMDSTTKDFKAQKNSFKEFMKLQEQHMTDEDKAIAKLNFEQSIASMDRKHGYNKKDAEAITKEEHDRRMEDLKLQREQQDIELTHENIFEGREFNPSEFNKMFEKKKRRDEKRKKTTGGLAKVDDGIAAFNDFDGGSGGVGLDQYDKLYSEGRFSDYNVSYAGIGVGTIGAENEMSDDDISIDSPDEDEYDSHKKGVSKVGLDDAMKRMMAERNEQNGIFDKMKHSDYGSAMDDKYGISNQFGFMVGNDKFGHQKNLKKRNIQEETMKAYKQLTEK